MRKENRPTNQSNNKWLKILSFCCSVGIILTILVVFETRLHMQKKEARPPIGIPVNAIREPNSFAVVLKSKQNDRQKKIHLLEQQLSETSAELTKLRSRLFRPAHFKISQAEKNLDLKQKETEELYKRLHLLSLQNGDTDQKNSWLNETVKELNSLVQVQQLQLDRSNDHFEQLIRNRDRLNENEKLDLHRTMEQMGASKQKLRDLMADQKLLITSLQEKLDRQSELLLQQKNIIKSQEEAPFTHFKELQEQIRTIMLAIEADQLKLMHVTQQLQKSDQTIQQSGKHARSLIDLMEAQEVSYKEDIVQLEREKTSLSEECLELNCLLDILIQVEDEEDYVN